MIEPGSLGPELDALLLVGIVLAEAIVLYVGYGALTRAAKPHVTKLLQEQ